MKSTFYIIISIFIFASCSDSDTVNSNTEFIITQEQLNATIYSWEENITGSPYGSEVSISHNSENPDPNSAIRDVFGNSAKDQAFERGTVITKRIYDTTNGIKDNILLTLAMVKRENGYDPANKDWEYIVMNNIATNYSNTPNGILPSISDTIKRGKLQNCISCHSKALGNDYVFVRD